MNFRTSIVNPYKHTSGMTLLEVMVALLIFALTGTTIMKAASDHLNSVEQIEQITFATWVANNRLNQLQLDPSWPLKNNYKGSQDMAGHTWYWQQRVEKTSDKEMVRVEVTVGLDEQYVGGITTVTTFITQQNKT